MNNPHQKFVQFLQTKNHSTIHYKRKINYKLSAECLTKLVYTYFRYFDVEAKTQTITIKITNLEDILFLLRYHFRLWITIDNLTITIYKKFPTRFRIVKSVTKTNHWFTPKEFEVGQIMYFNNHGYSSANWLKGIPLAENLKSIENTKLIPTVQINYDFIEPVLE